jgi:hypothetical protein
MADQENLQLGTTTPVAGETMIVTFRGEAASLLRQFVRESGQPFTSESAREQVVDALVKSEWVHEKVREHVLYQAGIDGGVFTEVVLTR